MDVKKLGARDQFFVPIFGDMCVIIYKEWSKSGEMKRKNGAKEDNIRMKIYMK